MYLPNADRAVVAREKITEYLLVLNHPDGGSKARFFYRFGFRPDEWEVFAEALRSICLGNEIVEVKETTYGVQYVIIGEINTPDGRNPTIRAVWQIDHGADYPRFISAYPPN